MKLNVEGKGIIVCAVIVCTVISISMFLFYPEKAESVNNTIPKVGPSGTYQLSVITYRAGTILVVIMNTQTSEWWCEQDSFHNTVK